MEQLKRGDKIYLDKEKLIESQVNQYLECRDGVVECYEYRDCSGYGSKTRLFLCRDTKHESVSLIRQTEVFNKEWMEQTVDFDSDSFVFLESIINGKKDQLGGKYTLVRDYNI